MTHQGNRYVNI